MALKSGSDPGAASFLRIPREVSVAAPNCVENVAPIDALETGVASTLPPLPPLPPPTTVGFAGRCEVASDGWSALARAVVANAPSKPWEVCELNSGAIGSEAPCHAVSTNAS